MTVRFKKSGGFNVVGIDPSTKTGLVILGSDSTVHCHKLIRAEKGVKGIERANAIADGILELISITPVDFAVIEGYGYGNAHTLATLVEIGTLIRYKLRLVSVPYVEVPPTSLKKLVSGKGNAKKDLMLLETFKRFGFETSDDNIADAYCLAQAGLVLRGVTDLPKAQVAALDAIKKSQVGICNQLQFSL